MTDFYCANTGVKQPEGYTFWVTQVDTVGRPHGTAHVSYHLGDLETARAAAILDTQCDWGFDDDEFLHVMGAAVGNVTIVEWDDGPDFF